MQIPERLALIGGSILLASTLVLVLKSQVLQGIPKIQRSVTDIYDRIGDAQNGDEFDKKFCEAQKKGWPTGRWGTSKYYIDQNDRSLHVGRGILQKPIADLMSLRRLRQVKAIHFDQVAQAPVDANHLLANLPNLDNVVSLYNLDVSKTQDLSFFFYKDKRLEQLYLSGWDTSNVTNMAFMFKDAMGLKYADLNELGTSHVTNFSYMFSNDYVLNTLDVDEWNTSQAHDMVGTFDNTTILRDLHINDWNVSNVADMAYMFSGNGALKYLDISKWNTKNVTNMNEMFDSDRRFQELSLGSDTILHGDLGIDPSQWTNGRTWLDIGRISDSQDHAGTWIKKSIPGDQQSRPKVSTRKE